MVIDVQDIYDEFNGGIIDPHAIHDFLAFAYSNWVLLLSNICIIGGRRKLDFKDYLGWGEPNFIPPYLEEVDPWIGETSADNRYVTVSGDDLLPDMHLGRLPVKTATAASQLIDKIISYETNSPNNDWNKQCCYWLMMPNRQATLQYFGHYC